VRELERDLPEAAGREAGGVPLARLVIVGAGRVGTAMARAADAAGLEVALAGRDDVCRACVGADVVLLCVPDAGIEAACREAAAAEPPPSFVGHTSGATTLDALAVATERGAQAFSLHPLQTVPSGNTDLTGAPVAIAGSTPEALAVARALGERLGMTPFEVPEEARAAYHAAASIASNFLITLEESAAALLGRIGVDDGRELLAPLVLRTAANWAEAGSVALTGPIARGDTETVQRHLAALRDTAPELADLYQALAERTRAVAESR